MSPFRIVRLPPLANNNNNNNNRKKIEMIFMVLSSWQSHCESSPGSFDECRLSAEVATNPQTKPTDSD